MQGHIEPDPAFAGLHVTSNFTFLRGASHPEELVRRAAQLGYRAIGITDVNSMAGIVRAHVASEEAGIPLAVGCRLVFDAQEGGQLTRRSLLVYATSREAYGRLCRLLTLGKRRAAKGECDLDLGDVLEHSEGLLAVALPPDPVDIETALDQRFVAFLQQLRAAFDQDRLSIAAPIFMGANDRGWLARLGALSERIDLPLVATGDVHYHTRERHVLQDVLTCIRSGCPLDEAGFRLYPNGERYLKSLSQLAQLFASHPRALQRSVEIAERSCAFQLSELRYQYPDEVCPSDCSPMQHLQNLTWRGARQRYPSGVPDGVKKQIEHEFRLIGELEYEPYFLTVHDLVQFACSRNILCQGRGAAANSAVCYCLGITSVDPERIDVLFERFVSKERDEPPDIDVDFEHERREEVIQYIYTKYGRERAALTAEVITYRSRSAIRDVGKALGLSLDAIERIAKNVDGWHGEISEDRLRELGMNPDERTTRLLIQLSNEIQGFPRHRSQHVGGFVITKGALCELVPIENAAMPDRTVIEWDKDDIDAMGMLKVDVLGLGMLTCVRKALDLVNEGRRAEDPQAEQIDFASVPAEDPAVYDMLCRADTVGVFQIESRAQMSMLPRLRPRCFYDLVIEVAIVRPGPIQGKMVHPYLRRRNGEEPVTYPSNGIRRVLEKTLGVPLFQEQVMALAVVGAGFTPGKADQLRRAMAAWKRKSSQLESLCEELMAGLVQNGYSNSFANCIYDQIQGFGEYGFPESHAASFALIVYVSAWLKCHHPAAFAAALINSQPMGFYAPAQIVRDAKEHDVEVLPVDVNHSGRNCTLEYSKARNKSPQPALRLGMRLVKGLGEADARRIEKCVQEHGPFEDLEQLHLCGGLRATSLRHLAQADAFQSMGLDSQHALWSVRALRDGSDGNLWSQPQTANAIAPSDKPRAHKMIALPKLSMFKRVQRDYASIQLSLKAHPLSFLRDYLERRNVLESAAIQDAEQTPHGRRVSTAGLVLGRQRPGTASGVVFVTLEDETGVANLIVRPTIFERDREAAAHASVLLAHGRIERAQSVVHLLVTKLESLDARLDHLTVPSRDFR